MDESTPLAFSLYQVVSWLYGGVVLYLTVWVIKGAGTISEYFKIQRERN